MIGKSRSMTLALAAAIAAAQMPMTPPVVSPVAKRKAKAAKIDRIRIARPKRYLVKGLRP
jgi:hypothetical protein